MFTILLFVSFTLLSAATFIDRFGAYALPEGGGHPGFGSLPSPGGLPSLGSLPSPGKGGASHLNSVSGVHPDNVKPSKINPNNIPSGNDHNINPNKCHIQITSIQIMLNQSTLYRFWRRCESM